MFFMFLLILSRREILGPCKGKRLTYNQAGPKGLQRSPTAAKYTGRGVLHSQRKRKIDMIAGEYQDQVNDEYGWSENDDALIDTLARPYDEEQGLL